MILNKVHTISFPAGVLEYTIIGQGPRNLLIFPGYGQVSTDLLALTSRLSDHYTCYCVHPFFVGNSSWNNPSKPLSENDWRLIFEGFLSKTQLQDFSIFGYSIGGRFALITFKHFHQQIDHLFLAAPDGLIENIWFRLATHGIGRVLFRHLIAKKELLPALINTLGRIGIISKKRAKFARVQLRSAEQQQLVYKTWFLCRSLRLPFNRFRTILANTKAHGYLFLGKFDVVIPARSFRKLSHPKLHHYVVPASHHGLLVDEEMIAKINTMPRPNFS